jgi:RecB family exonuclease
MAVTFPEMVQGEDVTVSATAFLTWRRCPERALARHEGTFDTATVAAFRGSLAHRIFARHLRDGPIDDATLVQACREEIGKSLNPPLVELGLTPSRLGRVFEEVRVLYDSFSRMAADDIHEVELQCDLEAAPGVRLRGVIDAVFGRADGGVTLTDWKTGELGEAEAQLAFYALVWTLLRGEAPVLVEAISVASGERVASAPDAESLGATAADVAAMVGELRGALATGARLARVAGPWCRYCPLLATCDEGSEAVAVLSA